MARFERCRSRRRAGTSLTEKEIKKLLASVRAGKMDLARAVEKLRRLPYEDLGFAKIDHHRKLRQGFPETIFACGKTPEQVAKVASRMLRSRSNILITRADPKVFRGVRRLTRQAVYHPLSRAITVHRDKAILGKGTILIVSAGTSDIPVAEEALVTAQMLGNRTEQLYDAGVAGIHRLMDNREALLRARVIICVAGMEGALPSVVAGLVPSPVIAVPTSIGYGASFRGIAALLAMLNSCASNVAVVNIDNGFGAACVASAINRL